MSLDVSFDVPAHIMQGLINGSYERVGGVIRKTGTKQVVTWLREGSSMLSNSSVLSSVSSAAGNIGNALSNFSNVASILNFAVSTMGFVIVLNRLKGIEQQLELAQDIFKTIDYKIDLSFYANFRAALDLAVNTFSMANEETLKMSAIQAINRFLEAEHHYTKLVDMEIDSGSQIADDYLSTLVLAYVTEVRCYLELEEIDTARRRIHEATMALRPRYEKHINTLLTSNPAAYLHPILKEQLGLKELTELYQWLNPGITENEVFDLQRENIFKLAQQPRQWVSSLPQAICLPLDTAPINKKTQNKTQRRRSKPRSGFEAIPQSYVVETFNHLPLIMTLMGSMAEDYNRLAMYESEVETIHQLGMSFKEWQQLAPPAGEKVSESGLMYITVTD